MGTESFGAAGVAEATKLGVCCPFFSHERAREIADAIGKNSIHTLYSSGSSLHLQHRSEKVAHLDSGSDRGRRDGERSAR